MALFNVPTAENSTAIQYVMNTSTGAWCRFEGWNANCFEVFNDDLYFGGNGVVYKAWDGLNDNTSNINYEMKTAFDYLDSRSSLKRYTMLRPLLATDASISPSIELCVDFEDKIPTSTATFTSNSGSEWDTTDWDVGDWAGDPAINKQWYSAQGVGYCASTKIRGGVKDIQVYLNAIDYQYEGGGSI